MVFSSKPHQYVLSLSLTVLSSIEELSNTTINIEIGNWKSESRLRFVIMFDTYVRLRIAHRVNLYQILLKILKLEIGNRNPVYVLKQCSTHTYD